MVIAIAIRYGAAPGYIAGAVAAASYTLFLCVDSELHLHLPVAQQMVQPFLLFTGGIAVGELTRSRNRRLLTMQQHYQPVKEALRELAQERQALADQNAELEQRIVNQSSSLFTLHRVAKMLHVLQVESVYTAIVGLVSDVLGAEACALYLWREGQLELHSSSPQSDRPVISSATTGIMGRAVREGRIVTIHDRLMDEDSRAIIDDPAVMAGPLVARDTQIFGIVAVEQLPFVKLNGASIRTFQILLDWSSAALANALEYEELQWKATARQSSVRDSASSHATKTCHEQTGQEEPEPPPTKGAI